MLGKFEDSSRAFTQITKKVVVWIYGVCSAVLGLREFVAAYRTPVDSLF